MLVSFVFMAATLTAADDPPTFSRDVAPILHQHCVTCHRPDGGAPLSFVEYEDAANRARLIAHVTGTGYMPPWKAKRGEVKFTNERGMDESEIATLQAWFEAGAPIGDEDAIPPTPVFPTEWHLGEPDILLEMEEDMPIPASGPDIYRNFVVRIPDLPEGTYLRGIDYRPRAITTAHHTLYQLDSTGRMRRRSEAQDRPGFGGMESNLSLDRIGGWAVGAQPQMLPDGVSIEVPPGTDLVLNAHFHPTGKPEVERAQIALYLSEEPPTRYGIGLDVPFGFGLAANINIPPGVKDHEVTDSFTMPIGAELAGITPHAHMLCTEISAVATFPDGETLTLIHVTNWDFAWQEQYRYEEPIFLPEGTRIDTRFLYDNTADNPSNPNNPPQRVTWGPETTDEMASIVFTMVTETQEQRAALGAGYRKWVEAQVGTIDLGILGPAARMQRRDIFDLDGDGRISFAEGVQGIRYIAGRAIGRTPNDMDAASLIGRHVFMTRVLPRAIPVVIIVIAVAALGIYLLVRRRHNIRHRHTLHEA